MSASRRLAFFVRCALAAGSLALGARAEQSAIIAVGAEGDAEYADVFTRWASRWEAACARGNVSVTKIGADAADARSRLQASIEAEPKIGEPLWIVLLGHGTFDGRAGKFNIRGDDVSADDLAAWLKPFERPVVIVAGFSASGAWLKPLAAPGRVVVTAAKSGTENNFARFGGYLANAFAEGADLDKDGQTSLLEAWLGAARQTADFYKGEGRLATEHSLLDDDADGLGTPADWFRGTRVVKKAQGKAAPDGIRASQLHLIPSRAEREWSPERRAQRDELERELASLRERRAGMTDDDYFAAVEAIAVKLARLYADPAS